MLVLFVASARKLPSVSIKAYLCTYLQRTSKFPFAAMIQTTSCNFVSAAMSKLWQEAKLSPQGRICSRSLSVVFNSPSTICWISESKIHFSSSLSADGVHYNSLSSANSQDGSSPSRHLSKRQTMAWILPCPYHWRSRPPYCSRRTTTQC